MASLDDVAREVGVSAATASRALRGLPRVSEATRERVRDAATRMGYVATPAATSLATGRTGTVGVVVPYIEQWFFGQVIVGVEQVLSRAGIDMLLYNLGGEAGRCRFFAELPLRRRVDAVVLLTIPLSEPETELILDLGVPVVAVGVSQSGIGSVRIDDLNGARSAMRHLKLLGHREIGFIGAGQSVPLGLTAPLDRRAAYLEMRQEFGYPENKAIEADGGFTTRGGEAAMSALLGGETIPTDVFAASDEMAFGALTAIRKAGLRSPDEISIIGFDDHDMSEFLDLSTVAQPVQQQGTIAAEMLIAQLQGDASSTTTTEVKTQLVIRGTTAPPGQRQTLATEPAAATIPGERGEV